MIFIQIDIDDQIVLVRAIRGSHNIPKIDGLNYTSNGTDNNGTVTLSEGQYVLFYNSSPVDIGTLATKKLEENTSGIKIKSKNSTGYNYEVILYDQSGVSCIYTTLLSPDESFDKIINNEGTMITTNLKIELRNDVRGSQYTFHILIGHTAYRRVNTIYGDDPNETTYAYGNDVALDIYYIEDLQNDRYGISTKDICHDTGQNVRLYRYCSVILKHESNKIREYVTGKFQLLSDCHNYDEAGSTIGMGVRPEFQDGNIQSPFYAYDGSSWSSHSISSPYSWLHGYYALRINDGTMYKYAVIRYIGSNEHTPTEGEVAVTYNGDFAHLTAVEWGDVEWHIGREAVIHAEIWSALSDIYEENPDSPTFTSDPSIYDYLWSEREDTVIEREKIVTKTEYVQAGMDFGSLIMAFIPILLLVILIPLFKELFTGFVKEKEKAV